MTKEASGLCDKRGGPKEGQATFISLFLLSVTVRRLPDLPSAFCVARNPEEGEKASQSNGPSANGDGLKWIPLTSLHIQDRKGEAEEVVIVKWLVLMQ